MGQKVEMSPFFFFFSFLLWFMLIIDSFRLELKLLLPLSFMVVKFIGLSCCPAKSGSWKPPSCFRGYFSTSGYTSFLLAAFFYAFFAYLFSLISSFIFWRISSVMPQSSSSFLCL